MMHVTDLCSISCIIRSSSSSISCFVLDHHSSPIAPLSSLHHFIIATFTVTTRSARCVWTFSKSFNTRYLCPANTYLAVSVCLLYDYAIWSIQYAVCRTSGIEDVAYTYIRLYAKICSMQYVLFCSFSLYSKSKWDEPEISNWSHHSMGGLQINLAPFSRKMIVWGTMARCAVCKSSCYC